MSASSLSSLLERFRRTVTPRGRRRDPVFWVEGTRLLARALAVDWPLVAALAPETPTALESELLDGLRTRGVPVQAAPRATIDTLCDGRTPGVVALGRCQTTPLTTLCTSGPVLVAVDLEDAGNVGALCRTALAAGAQALLAVGRSDPFHPKAVRTSMGAVFKLPIGHVHGLASVLGDLPARVRPIASVARDGRPLSALDPDARVIWLLVGNEARGLPRDLSDGMERVTIPMSPEVDSFSVNAASAILLHSIRRST